NRVQNVLLAATLALRAYRARHGVYPETLGTLAPDYLHCVPDDPFAVGHPLQYKRTSDGYVLYSVAPDGTDDGGKAIVKVRTVLGPKKTDRIVRADSRGDVVAGVNL